MHPVRDRSFYSFTCTSCGDEVRKPAGAEVVRLLTHGRRGRRARRRAGRGRRGAPRPGADRATTCSTSRRGSTARPRRRSRRRRPAPAPRRRPATRSPSSPDRLRASRHAGRAAAVTGGARPDVAARCLPSRYVPSSPGRPRVRPHRDLGPRPGARPRPDRPRCGVAGRPAGHDERPRSPARRSPSCRSLHAGRRRAPRSPGPAAAQPAWAARTPRDRAAVLLRLHDLVLRPAGRAPRPHPAGERQGPRGTRSRRSPTSPSTPAGTPAGGRPLLADVRHRGIVPVLTQGHRGAPPQGRRGRHRAVELPAHARGLATRCPALLAGNAVVLKPDTRTALTALAGAELLAEAGLPDGLLQVVVGDGPVVGAALVDAVDHVCFTGSTATGRHRRPTRAGARLVGASLELGGKNALLRRRGRRPRPGRRGRRPRLLLQRRPAVRLDRAARAPRGGRRRVPRPVPRPGPPAAARRRSGLLGRRRLPGLAGPARPRHGPRGRRRRHGRHGAGRWPAPPRHRAAVLRADRARRRAARGRLLPARRRSGRWSSVYRVGSDAEAVALANDTDVRAQRHGLDPRRAPRQGARPARSWPGRSRVNEAYIASWGSRRPRRWAGARSSGLGRRHGREGLLRFTEPQTVAVQRGLGFGMLYAQGSERFTEQFTAMLRMARKAHLPWP